jgi:hypothetical protein
MINNLPTRFNEFKSNFFTHFIFFVMLFFAVSDVNAAINNISSAINESGRQRMLTQRILKEYILIGLDVKQEIAKKNRAAAVSRFEKNLLDLSSFVVNSKISEKLRQADELWQQIKPVAIATPDKSKVINLRQDLEKLLILSHQVVLLLVKESGDSKGEMVNIAGRQRMLSQRMANLYLLKAWELSNISYNKDLQLAMSDFRIAQKKLQKYERNTKNINRLLQQVKTQFSMFEYTLKSKSGKFIPGVIAKASEKILVNMNKAVGLYENL